jgi:predicted lipoprotein with Yx(FWY)xxD motif
MRVSARRMLGMQSLILLGLIAAGVALAAQSARTVTVKVSAGLGGKYVVNSAGMTLYHYTGEAKGKIDCTGTCKSLWPPQLAGSAKPVAGPGIIASKLGTIKRPDGGIQLTYNGLALYRYSGDKKPGQTNGQGVEGSWFAVTPAGKITKAKVTTESSPSSSATSVSNGSSSGSTSSGGGYGAGAGTSTGTNHCTPGAIVTDMNSPCYNY